MEGFRLESHWCAWSGFGTQPHYEMQSSRWPSNHTWNSVVIDIGWVRLPPFQWTKAGLRAAKWLIKKSWTNFTFCFSAFITVYNKQANIRCSTGSILRPISSWDHNATDQATPMIRYQSYFRKIDNFFSGKQQSAVRNDQKNLFSSYLQFLHGGKDFQSSFITFDIFNNSPFFSTIQKANENYKAW